MTTENISQPDRKALAERRLKDWCEASGNYFLPNKGVSMTCSGVRYDDLLQLIHAAIAAHPVQEPADAGALDREVSEWFAENARAALATPAAPAVPDDGNLNGKYGPLVEHGWDGGINERAEFEAAMILKGALPITATAGFFDGIGEFWFERDEKGRYKFSRMQDVWEGWQARGKVAAPSAQPTPAAQEGE